MALKMIVVAQTFNQITLLNI